jgi:hypothetical protein
MPICAYGLGELLLIEGIQIEPSFSANKWVINSFSGSLQYNYSIFIWVILVSLSIGSKNNHIRKITANQKNKYLQNIRWHFQTFDLLPTNEKKGYGLE